MSRAEKITDAEQSCRAELQRPPVVIVGAGPVGQRLAAELRRHDSERDIVMFGDEPWAPYDRVQLSSWLASKAPEIDPVIDDAHLRTCLGMSITAIDRENREVIDAHGVACRYEKLILATGSSARVPPIQGVRLPGVFTFRNLSDAQSLKACSVSSRSMVVVGGGLLGLETARALHRFNTNVTIIEASADLMYNQLDGECAAQLEQHVSELGIEVITSARVKRILGETRMEGVLVSDGRFIECDTVVLAAGITPNVQLARDCGLNTGRGILVDDQMQTSDTHIYAVGECAEHRQTVYGLAALATLLWFSPLSLPYADSVQASLRFDVLWRNGLFKQISGFSLLALSLLLTLVSIRKRLPWLHWGSFDGWRVAHVLAGVLTVSILVAHTGFRMGDNLNFWLMLVFSGLLLAGAAVSAVVGLQHVLPLTLAWRTRELSIWAHVLLLWPLPVLLGFHVLKTYWY